MGMDSVTDVEDCVKKLMIVESPHKARVISGFLGADWRVVATRGYMFEIHDTKTVPAAKKDAYGRFGVRVDDGSFDVLKQVIRGSAKTLEELRSLVNSGEYDEFYVSTDPDRAGEQIGAEVVDYLARDLKRNNVRVLRATWHEITKHAVLDGIAHPGALDRNMVAAAEARQIYDRLFGYMVSPYLWRTVGPKTSGGRAQSPALRLIVDREKARINFVCADYASVDGVFRMLTSGSTARVRARLVEYDGRTVATGAGFDADGRVKRGLLVLDNETGEELAGRLRDASWSVGSVSSKPYTRRPPAPYTTSTMQQDIGTRLGLGTKRITDIAQALYEHSFITYIRSDAPFLAPEAAAEARRVASARYGASSVPASGVRQYTAKGKNVQAGHEAIRPVLDDNGRFRSPDSIRGQLTKIDAKAYDFYKCVYNRTVASQMNDARGTTTTVSIESNDIPVNKTAGNAKSKAGNTGNKGDKTSGRFTASGTVITEPGWMQLTRPVDDDSGEPREAFPDIHGGDSARLEDTTVTMHSTTPPARFTEPQLVAELEHRGIGRPATYSQIVMVNQERGYVVKKGKQLYPTFKGMQVAQILETMLPGFVDYGYTADMEQHLDDIEQGKTSRNKWLQESWDGKHGINTIITPLTSNIDWDTINRASTIRLTSGYEVQSTRHGAYLQRTASTADNAHTANNGSTVNTADSGSTVNTVNNDNSVNTARVRVEDDLLADGVPDEAALAELLTHAPTTGPRVLGVLNGGPYAGWEVSVRDGRNGEYLMARKLTRNGTPARGAKPVFNALPDGYTGETVGLEQAETVYGDVKLPRHLDDHYFVGEGARGAYIGWKATAKGRAKFISMPDSMNPRTVTLDEVVKYWNEHKPASSGRTTGSGKRSTASSTAKQSKRSTTARKPTTRGATTARKKK